MQWEDVFSFVFRTLPTIFHLLGIYLLLTVHFKQHWQKIQARYLLWLSVVEVVHNLHHTVKPFTQSFDALVIFRLDLFVTGIFGTMIMLILMALTIDRAVFIWLNLRYKPSKANTGTKIVLFLSLIIVIIVTLVLFLTQKTKNQFISTQTLYFWPLVDALVLITFVFCYFWIFKIIQRRSPDLLGVESKRYAKRMRHVTLLPKLIVMSFFICWVIMDSIYLGLTITGLTAPSWLDFVASALYSSGYLSDALIYILFSRSIRKLLIKKVFCCFC